MHFTLVVLCCCLLFGLGGGSNIVATAKRTRYPTSRPTVGPKNSSAPFTIRMMYDGAISAAARRAFESAAARWKQVITRAYPTQVFIPKNRKVCAHKFTKRTLIKDMIIVVKLAKMDGPGNAVADAGPCIVDQDNRVRAGVVMMDKADVTSMTNQGTLASVAAHEIGHSLGLGADWQRRGLVTNELSPYGGYQYHGQQGNLGNAEVGGRPGGAVVEDMGDSGTAGGHWKESFYGTELMTGYLEERGVNMPLSRLTVRALEDLGYTVDVTKADAYTAPVLDRRRLRREEDNTQKTKREDNANKQKTKREGCGKYFNTNRTMLVLRSVAKP